MRPTEDGNHNNLTVGVDYGLTSRYCWGCAGLYSYYGIVERPRGFQAAYSAIYAPVRRGWITLRAVAKFGNIQRSITSGAKAGGKRAKQR